MSLVRLHYELYNYIYTFLKITEHNFSPVVGYSDRGEVQTNKSSESNDRTTI